MANTTIQLTVGLFALTGNDLNALVGRLLQLSVGQFTLTGNPIGAFRGVYAQMGTGFFSLTGFDLIADAFPAPTLEDDSTNPPLVAVDEPDTRGLDRNQPGTAPTWRAPSSSGVHWRLNDSGAPGWRHG